MSGISRNKGFLAVACLGALVAGLLSLVSLAFWAAGFAWTLGLPVGRAAMAPLTAWLILGLALGLLSQVKWPGRPATRWLIWAVGLAAMAGGLAVLVPWLPFLDHIFKAGGPVDPGPQDMSAAAGLGCLLGGLSLLLLALPSRVWRRRLAPLASLALLLFCLLVLLGYALGDPQLYGGLSLTLPLPMSLASALALALLAIGLLAAAGPETWVFSAFTTGAHLPTADSPNRSLRTPLTAFLLLALAIGGTGYYYLQNQLLDASQAARRELMAVLEMKQGQIAAWLRERQADAAVVLGNPVLQENAHQFLAGDHTPRRRLELQSWLDSMQRQYGYQQVILYDGEGKPRLGAPQPLAPPDREGLEQALTARGVLLTDLHLLEGDQEPGPAEARMALWSPVRGPDDQERAAGAMQLLIDPNQSLYPMVMAWPTPSTSAECTLIRREGDHVQVLNELRHRPGQSLRMRVPLSSAPAMPWVLAAQGLEIPAEGGRDYRGRPVLAVWRPVPDTPWILVAKMDLAEVYERQMRLAWSTGLVMVFLLLAAATSLSLFWRRRESQWLSRQLAVDGERREMAQRFLQLNEQANDIILLFDQDWLILEANQRAQQTYGLPLARLLGMHASELRAPQAREQFARDTQGADDPEGIIYQTLHQRCDGTVFPVEVSMRSVELGGERYRQSLIRDISERRRAEEALRASEGRFRATFEQVAVGMVHTDAQGRFLRVNQRFCEFLGYTPEQTGQLGLADVIHPADLSSELQALAQLISGEQEVHTRVKRYLRQDGAVVWGRVTRSVVRDAQERPLYIISVVEDFTEQRKLENQLRQSQKMEALGTLSGGIAHDFNNILGVVLGYAEMALEDATRGQVDPRDLRQVIQAALRAKDLVRQILTFSRKSEAELRPLDLNLCLEQARSILERTLSKMVRIETSLDPRLDLINGDPNQLEQVVLNLANNAQDAMPEGGQLLIETRNIDLDRRFCQQHAGMEPGPHVLLTVYDSGLGMDPATREKVFDPFFTTKEVGKGTGLGLSMVYGIVKGHRGHISCYSEPGQGTSFKIYLPSYLSQGRPQVPDLTLDEGTLRGGETILLVDDEEPLRQLGARILEEMGYRVLSAASGEQALEFFTGLWPPPALVILDLGMPGMGGRKCLERILELVPGQKVAIASGYSANGPVKASLGAGAMSYIAKPFRRLELLMRVRLLLDQA